MNKNIGFATAAMPEGVVALVANKEGNSFVMWFNLFIFYSLQIIYISCFITIRAVARSNNKHACTALQG